MGLKEIIELDGSHSAPTKKRIGLEDINKANGKLRDLSVRALYKTVVFASVTASDSHISGSDKIALLEYYLRVTNKLCNVIKSISVEE
jgi:hypothetical protein